MCYVWREYEGARYKCMVDRLGALGSELCPGLHDSITMSALLVCCSSILSPSYVLFVSAAPMLQVHFILLQGIA